MTLVILHLGNRLDWASSSWKYLGGEQFRLVIVPVPELGEIKEISKRCFTKHDIRQLCRLESESVSMNCAKIAFISLALAMGLP